MKRLLAFLLLFGAGIGLILLLQEPTLKAPAPRKEVREQRPPGETPVTRVQLGGRIQYKSRAKEGETRPMLYQLDAADSGQPEGAAPDEWEMREVTILLFDPESGEVRARIDAASARGIVRSIPGAEPTFELDPIVELTGATVVAHRDAPIVPLTLEVPSATVDLDARTLRSGAPSRVFGPGLDARGEGLAVELEAQRYVFPAEGRAAVRFEERRGAVIGSVGELRVVGGGGEGGPEPGQVEVVAEGGAWLVPTEPGSEDPLAEAVGRGRLDARRIVLTAAERPGGPSEGFVPVQGTAEGEVVYASAAGDFAGERALLRFDAAGLSGAFLSGSPRVRLVLGGGRAAAGPPGPPARDLRLSGATSLDLDLRAGEATLEGPGRMVFGAAQLTARDRILADFPVDASDPRPPRVHAFGDVVLDHEGRRLVTPELVASREPSEREETVLRGVAIGPSRATGQDPDGNPVAITTGERLEVLIGDERFELPLARRVEIAVGGEVPLRAQADELRDLDPDARAFDAEGAVRFERGDSSLQGTAMSLRGLERWSLGGEPAVYAGPGVRAEARSIERLSAEELRASGDVSARLRGDDGLLALESEDLSVRREARGDGFLTHVFAREVTDTGFTFGQHGERLRADELEAWVTSRPALPGEIREIRETREIGEAGETGETEPADEEPAEVWLEVRVEARGDVAGTARTRTSEYALACGELEGFAERDAPGAPERGRFTARGGVEVSAGPDPLLHGRGDEWTVDHEGRGRLESTGPRRVDVEGFLPAQRTRFDVEADYVDFSPEHLLAEAVRGRFLQTAPGERRDATEVHGEAGRLYATRERVSLTDGVEVFGSTSVFPSWDLRSGRAEVDLQAADEESGLPGGIAVIEAWDEVVFHLGDEGRLTGDHLVARSSTGAVRTTGRPARLERSGLVWESPWVEFDLNLHLPRSGPGTMRVAEDAGGETWTLSYRTLETLVQPDRLIQAVQSPVLLTSRESRPVETRASWAVLWLDRRGWSELSTADLRQAELELQAEEEREARPKQVPEYFQALRDSALGGVLHELYLEGPIEVITDGERLLLAEAFYLDAIDGHGWIADLDLSLPRTLGGEEARLVLHADWVRHSEDGTLRADDAILTACEYEDRHVYIVSRDLRIRPVADPLSEAVYDVELRRNAIHLYGLLVLPLPSIRPLIDEEGEISLLESLRLGNSARLGSFLEAGFEDDLGRVGERVNKALGGEPDRSRARYKVRGSILGSRGVLVDLSTQLRSDKPYWWNFHIGGVNDTSEDKGLLRVSPDDRDAPRLWARSRGRYYVDDQEWFELVFSSQTDPAVQSEFWEGSYLRFEERESDVHWRKAVDENYFFGRAAVRADTFRTDVERVPELGLQHAPTPLLHVAGQPVLYSTDLTAAALQREEGDFEGPFADGFGERDVVRVDNTHRLEVPLGRGAVRATPFAELRGTYWDEDVTGAREPTRASLVGGLRVATTLWKPLGANGVQQISPFFEIRRDAFVEEQSGVPVPFDQVERPVEGQFVDLGLRGRWMSGGGDFVDLEVRGTHARDVAPGEPNGWLPLGLFGRVQEHVGSVPVAIEVDTRYDLEDEKTAFSRTTLGLKPSDAWTFELGHRRGLAADDTALYEAATYGARYRWSPKWEFEVFHERSLQGATSLGTTGVVRRYGHDLVFEIEISDRSGEGSSVSIDLSPLLGWSTSRLGEIDF